MGLLLLLSRFSRVQLCATPWTAAHQAPPFLRFSRQEHWSGLPFPFPMHESGKWKWKWSHVRLLATPWTTAYQAPPSMGFSRQEYWSGVPLPCAKLFQSCPTLCNQATEVAHQALLSIGFSRQEYWRGLPCPPPRNLLNPGIEPTSLTSPALASGFFTTRATWEAHNTLLGYIKKKISRDLVGKMCMCE